jgi:excisionase family DNA binding protein
LREFLTIDELSEYLAIKRSTLYSMVESGLLPHYRIGRLIRFKRDDVDRWMESHRKEGSDTEKKVKVILRAISRPSVDVDHLVKKSIEEIRGSGYTVSYGKPDRIKGLGKEVEDGTL